MSVFFTLIRKADKFYNSCKSNKSYKSYNSYTNYPTYTIYMNYPLLTPIPLPLILYFP